MCLSWDPPRPKRLTNQFTTRVASATKRFLLAYRKQHGYFPIENLLVRHDGGKHVLGIELTRER